MREALTAVISRAEPWSGTRLTEPYEVGWAGEAIVFVRAIEAATGGEGELVVLISPDGIHWSEEGTRLPLPGAADASAFARLGHFGHFLCFRAELPEGATGKYVLTLSLKE